MTVPGPLVAGSEVTFRANWRDQDNSVIPLTSATVTFSYSISGAATVSRAATIVDSDNGIAEYTFTAGELTAGSLKYQWKLVDGGGKTFYQNSPNLLEVTAPL